MQWCRIEYGRLLARAGFWDKARDVWLAGWLEHPAADSIHTCMLSLLLGRAEVRRKSGREAAERLAPVERWLEDHPAPYVRAHAHQLRAEMQMLQGQAVDAITAATATLEAFDKLPATPDAAAAALDFARLAE